MREFPTPQEILKVFEREPGKTFRLRELVVELGLRSSQARDLKNALKVLSRNRRVVYLKKNHFALAGRERQAADSRIDAMREQQVLIRRQSKIGN